MSTIKIKDFNLCTLYVDHFDENLKFYTEILGMKKIRDMEPGVLLSANDQLTIYLEGGREPGPTAGMEGPCTSICFSTEEGIKTSYEKLKDAGVRMVGKYFDFGPEFHMFRIADPSGNIIEFAGKP